MTLDNLNSKGLSSSEVTASRSKNGSNIFIYKKENVFLKAIQNFVQDPMVVLLLVAAVIYFMSGKISDGIFLSAAIVLISLISSYQNARSKNALQHLKDQTKPNAKVIRDSKVITLKTEELVLGDCLLVEEGTSIPADATIIHANDFSVNEALLTGESLAVTKDQTDEHNFIFQGTTVSSGLAIATITGIGNQTKLGKIGKSLENIKEEKTPLEIQIGNFVKKMALVGAFIFALVWGINYYQTSAVFDSLLKALTLAMSILPEEIPIAFTTFMALGAYRMFQKGSIVKQMKTVETLGSATVICIDKTGTITENTMSLAKLFLLETDSITAVGSELKEAELALLTTAMFASELIPFDPMEMALHDSYSKMVAKDIRPEFKMIHEYPLSGKPPMMTHVFATKHKQIVAAKGAPEALLAICSLSDDEKKKIGKAIQELTSEGYRILAVAEATFEGKNFPKTQQEFPFHFQGLVAFYDPPKKNIRSVLTQFYKAGIAVKIITGDNAETTTSIAKQIGFIGYEQTISGDDLMKLSDKELKKQVKEINLFTRMFPEAKLRIITALKSNHEIVAMTGDGVNDGPALKAAHIGIAMGKKGTEIAKQAASLILIKDDLSHMVEAIAMGRKIYSNLKKAIQFIISIHIPIILTVLMPLILGWKYPAIFSPIHIIFLELIMGPTCSIVYENEPMEKNTMIQKPRPFTDTFFNWKELSTSILQGLVITAGTLFVYQYAVHSNYDEALTRTMVFTCLITANIFLTLSNRSFYYSILTTIQYKNNLIPRLTSITILVTILLLYWPVLTTFFELKHLNGEQLILSVSVGFVVVIWYELVKLWKRNSTKK